MWVVAALFVALVAFVALWATYLFDVGPMSDQTAFAPDSPFARIPQSLLPDPARTARDLHSDFR